MALATMRTRLGFRALGAALALALALGGAVLAPSGAVADAAQVGAHGVIASAVDGLDDGATESPDTATEQPPIEEADPAPAATEDEVGDDTDGAEAPGAPDGTDSGMPTDDGDESTTDEAPDGSSDERSPSDRGEQQRAPEPPMAPQAAALTCAPGTFYSIRDTGSLRQITNGTVTNPGIDLGDGNSWNGLGIGVDGTVWGYLRSADLEDATVYRYDPATGTSTRVVGPYETAGGLVAGAVDLRTDDYYFGGWTTSGGTRYFSLYKVAAGGSTVTYVGRFNDVDARGSANGDMAFDAQGNLYVVRSGDSTTIFTVSRATLESATGGTLTRTYTTPGSGSGMLSNVNGIAFDSDGTVYLGNGTTAARYNPATWTRIGSDITTDLGSSTDLASCVSPANFTLLKDIEDRRYDADQFVLSITQADGTVITTTTTADDPSTWQLGPIPIRIGNEYLAFEQISTGSTSQLSDYHQDYTCTRNDVPVNFSVDAQGRIHLQVSVEDAGAEFVCTITNTPKNADLTVNKEWVVDGVEYAHGHQPGGIDAALQLTKPDGSYGSVPWGEKQLRYDWSHAYQRFSDPVELGETVSLTGDRSLCRIEEQRITDVNGAPQTIDIPTEGPVTIPAELLNDTDSVVTVTNTVSCATEFDLTKSTPGYDGDWSFEFDLDGPGAPPTIVLTNEQPSTGQLPIQHGQTYTLTEVDAAAHWSQGDPVCVVKNVADEPVADADSETPGFQFSAKPGQQVSCAVENTTAELTLLKEVEGDLVAADFTLTAAPAPGVDGLAPISGPGTPTLADAPTGFVLPGWAYEVTETTSDPDLAYLNDGTLHVFALDLGIGEEPTADQLADPANWTVVDAAEITAESGSHVIVKLVNEQAYGPVLPMAGGTGNLPYLVGGGTMLVLTALVGLAQRRRAVALNG